MVTERRLRVFQTCYLWKIYDLFVENKEIFRFSFNFKFFYFVRAKPNLLNKFQSKYFTKSVLMNQLSSFESINKVALMEYLMVMER